jgi:hypothetical protein
LSPDCEPRTLTPPDGLRPAQAGIVLVGRVILGHLGATVADLAQRGYLELEETPRAAQPDWVLTDRRGQAADQAALLPFELTLCEGLFAGEPRIELSGSGQRLVPTLDRVRQQIVRDAIGRGWIRRWHRQRRTPRGEDLLVRIQVFRRELRALARAGDAENLAGLAPYAMVFGLTAGPSFAGDGDHARPDQRRELDARWQPADRFAAGWLSAFAACTATGRHGDRPGSGGTFAREWSMPRQPAAGRHDHGPAHGSGHDSPGGHAGHVGGAGHPGR